MTDKLHAALRELEQGVDFQQARLAVEAATEAAQKEAASHGRASWVVPDPIIAINRAYGPDAVAAWGAWQALNGLLDENRSPTWSFVFRFACAMEDKLAANRDKGDRPGWLKMPIDRLWKCLEAELSELALSLPAGTAEEVLQEAADVGNFAMMIADHYAHREAQHEA